MEAVALHAAAADLLGQGNQLGDGRLPAVEAGVEAGDLRHTGQPFDKVTQDTDRDYFMSAEEAKEYSIVDRVIEHH